MAIAIKIEGIDTLLKDINKTIKQAEDEKHKALVKFESNVVKDAKAKLQSKTSNTGKLANSIFGDVKGDTATIVVTANYAAYIEFGTRKFAAQYVSTLPADWKSYAATFKGKGGGDMNEFIQNIMQWVQQRGIGALKTKSGNNSTSASSLDAMQQAAYGIALHILRNGIRPQPYLFPAVEKHTPTLIADIKKIFE